LFEKYWYDVDAAKKDDSWLSGLRFWRGKSSPAVSFMFDFFSGKDFIGREFSWKNAILSRTLPLTYTQTYNSIYYDRYASVMKETNAMTGDRDLANGLIMLVGTGVGLGLTQYPSEDSTEAESMAWEMYEPHPGGNRKPQEQRRVEIGLRNLFRLRKKMAADSMDVANVDKAIAKYAGVYEIDPKTLAKLRKQGEEGDFAFVTKGLTDIQVEKILKVATPEQRPELEAILAEKRENVAKKNKPPKPLANRLHIADVEESIKLWKEHSEGFTAKQKLEFKNRLRSKAMNSNKQRHLSRENYDEVKKILGTFPPHLGERKVEKPIRGLDSLKNIN
jgi:hypothetical protein